MLKPTIEVLSSPMGTGKTTLLIERMKHRERPTIYITPYLEECRRVQEACKGYIDFHEPTGRKDGTPFTDYAGAGTKTKHLRRLLQAGQSVVATHNLFHHLRSDMLRDIQSHDYALVMDEVIEVAQAVGITADQVDELVEQDVLRLGPMKSIAKQVMQVFPGENTSRNAEKLGPVLTVGNLHQKAKAGRLMTVEGRIVFWMFPVNFFQSFSAVTVATFLFDGSHLRRYYDLHDLEYSVKAVSKVNGRYGLIEPDAFDMESYLTRMRDKIEILNDQNLNTVGEPESALSYGWWTDPAQREHRIKLMQAKVDDLLNRKAGRGWNRKEHFMFTCFKDSVEQLTSHRNIPKDCWLAHNTRATNKYINKKTVAYLVNRYLNPFLVQGFQKAGVEINEDHFALSEMLQFIYRSRIRKGWKIKVWVPSRRMRGLLEGWLAGEIK